MRVGVDDDVEQKRFARLQCFGEHRAKLRRILDPNGVTAACMGDDGVIDRREINGVRIGAKGNGFAMFLITNDVTPVFHPAIRRVLG